MSEHVDEKAERFERLWEGMTPKGYNRAKALKFLSLIHISEPTRLV